MRELWQKIQHGLGRLSGRFINGLIEEWNNTKREARAIGRVLLSGIGLMPLGYCLWQWMHHRHWMPGQPRWLMLAVGSLIVFVLILKRLGNGQGMAHGFWLWLLSVGLVTGMAAGSIAFIGTLGWVLDEDKFQGQDFAIGLALFWIVALIALGFCDERLRHAEEQTP